jgi:hypothetical protein
MRDSEFQAYTPKPANLAEWRVKRAVKAFLERDSTRDRSAGAVPGSRDFPTRTQIASAEPGGLPLLILFYIAIWLATWAIAHVHPGLALGIATAFVIVPGLYVLAGIRIARVAQMLHRDRV